MPPDRNEDVTTSIVIPAYNEAPRLRRGFDRLRAVLEQLDLARGEFVIVDDGSSDDTALAAQRLYSAVAPTRVVRFPTNQGKGAALRLGIGVARGDRILTVDADMAIDPRHYPAMLERLADVDLVPGSRAVHGHVRYASRSRTMAGRVFNRLVRHYTGVVLVDTQCGAKALRRGPARLIALLATVNGFSYDAELFLLARRLGLAVAPHPVTWEDVAGSSVHLRTAPLAMIADLRGLRTTPYELPVIEVDRDVALDAVGLAAQRARLIGVVVAQGATNALVVVARDAAVGATSVAAALGGTLRTAGLDELAGRNLRAV